MSGPVRAINTVEIRENGRVDALLLRERAGAPKPKRCPYVESFIEAAKLLEAKRGPGAVYRHATAIANASWTSVPREDRRAKARALFSNTKENAA